MVIQQYQQKRTVHIHYTTKNESFIKIHYYLRDKGIKNNNFFLALYDSDLENINPRDPRLPDVYKQKVLIECMSNFWYFIREIVRIPVQGGAIGDGIPYKLSRGNLALNWGFINNWNMFLELPRQHGKTISAICWYLWVFNFKTTNSEIILLNKKHDDSKLNLKRLKDIRDALPSYLQMKDVYGVDGTKLKPKDNVTMLEHPTNGNVINTKSGARNKAAADGLGRGCTVPMQWYDEYAFILYNSIIYAAATPAFKTAADNAKKNGVPYGILITTTPGDLTTDEGLDAFNTKESAIKFEEEFYDFTYQQIQEIRNLNDKSTFFYMRFTYQDLGSGQEYFKDMVKELKQDWNKIRREVMLEWSTSSDNSPFTKQDLDTVGSLVRPPITSFMLNRIYKMNVYKKVDFRRHPPIIGVDVSGGYNKDSSAITIIDSETTEVIADLNCNYISIPDLANCIHELVIRYMPNAIVNIERNGGFGASVIALLKKTSVKKNLYFEIKDRVVEERFEGYNMSPNKRKVKTKVYGFDETKESRNLLMEILRDRMDNHKRKFVSPIIYEELKTLEYKKNGRIEHTDKGHDDQIFSYLMALYVWYYGQNLMEFFGLDKRILKTDNDEESELEIMGLEERYTDLSDEIETEMDDDSELKSQLDYIKSDNTMLYSQWLESERQKDEAAMEAIKRSKLGRKAYAEKFHIDEEDIGTTYMTRLPDSVFNDMYDTTEKKSDMQTYFDNMGIPR